MYSTPGRPQGTLPCAPQGCSCIAPRFLPGGSELTPDSTAMISVPHGQASPPGVPDTADTIVYDRPAPAPAPSQYPQGPSPSVSGVLVLLPNKTRTATGGNRPLPWREATPTAAATPRAAGGAPRVDKAAAPDAPRREQCPRRDTQEQNLLYTQGGFRRSHGERVAGKNGLNYHALGVPGYIQRCPLGMVLGHRLGESRGASRPASRPVPGQHVRYRTFQTPSFSRTPLPRALCLLGGHP